MTDIVLGAPAAALRIICQRGGAATFRWTGTVWAAAGHVTDDARKGIDPSSLRWNIVADMIGGEIVLRGVTNPDGSVEWQVTAAQTSEWPRGSYPARMIVHEAPVGEPTVVAIGSLTVEDI